MIGEIDSTEWVEDGFETRRFKDIDTIKQQIETMGDYGWSLRLTAQWLKLRQIGVVQTARNQADNAWLALCYPEEEE
jgi:RNase P/RNase MRP subunit POP5